MSFPREVTLFSLNLDGFSCGLLSSFCGALWVTSSGGGGSGISSTGKGSDGGRGIDSATSGSDGWGWASVGKPRKSDGYSSSLKKK